MDPGDRPLEMQQMRARFPRLQAELWFASLCTDEERMIAKTVCRVLGFD
jgi:hypothetical protein